MDLIGAFVEFFVTLPIQFPDLLNRTIVLLDMVGHLFTPQPSTFQIVDQMRFDDNMLARQCIPGIEIAEIAVDRGGRTADNGDRSCRSDRQQHSIPTRLVVVISLLIMTESTPLFSQPLR